MTESPREPAFFLGPGVSVLSGKKDWDRGFSDLIVGATSAVQSVVVGCIPSPPGGPALLQGSPQSVRTLRHKVLRAHLADFLGVSREPPAMLEGAMLAHAVQGVYSGCQEACEVALPYINAAIMGPVGPAAIVSMYGLLRTTFHALQATGGFTFGWLSDRYGVKSAMLLAHASASAFAAAMFFAGSPAQMFLALLPATAMHGYQSSMLVAARSSPQSLRATAMGRLGVTSSLGIFIGSIASRKIALLSPSVLPPAKALVLAVSIVEAVSCICLAYAMPNDEDLETQTEDQEDEEAKPMLNVFQALAQRDGISQCLLAKLGFTAGCGMVLSLLPQLVVGPMFNLAPHETALVLAFQSGAAIIAQGVAGPLLDALRAEVAPVLASVGAGLAGCLVVVGATNLLVTGLVTAHLTKVASLTISLLPLSGALAIAHLTLSQQLTMRVPPEEAGSILGLDLGIASLAGIFSPLIGVQVVNHVGFPALALTGAVVVSATSAGVIALDGCEEAVQDVLMIPDVATDAEGRADSEEEEFHIEEVDDEDRNLPGEGRNSDDSASAAAHSDGEPDQDTRQGGVKDGFPDDDGQSEGDLVFY